jgi:initiation factor 1A
MVLNKTGGNKTKKQKRNFGKYDAVDKIDSDQMFAQITKNHGGSFSVLCSDGIIRLGKLSGYMKKGPRLSEGSYVVISLRNFEAENKNCDIIAYGDPSNDIVNMLKTNDPNGHKKADIDFVDSDNEFQEFEESSRTMINIDQTVNTNTGTGFNNISNSNTNDDIWNDI